jgi:hypothetical protein
MHGLTDLTRRRPGSGFDTAGSVTLTTTTALTATVALETTIS